PRPGLSHWPSPVARPPRRAAGRPRPRRDPVLLRAALRPADRMPAELHRPRQPAALGADHLRRLADLVVRRELRPKGPARRGVRRLFLAPWSLHVMDADGAVAI